MQRFGAQVRVASSSAENVSSGALSSFPRLGSHRPRDEWVMDDDQYRHECSRACEFSGRLWSCGGGAIRCCRARGRNGGGFGCCRARGEMGHTQASGGLTEEGSRPGVAAGSATADASAHVPTDAVAASGIAAVTPSVAAEHGGVGRTPPGLAAATAEHGAARAGAADPGCAGAAAQAGAAEHGGEPAEAPGDAPVLHLSAMDLQRMQRDI